MKITRPNSNSIDGEIHLTFSKSESNRALIIKALCDDEINIKNLSDSDDTQTLKTLLKNYKTQTILDVLHAGTTFRFLTAFLATQNGEWTLTGSNRMKERPIGILVDVLNQCGAEIIYLEKTGYPPLQIKGKKINLSHIEIDGSISSQFISALLLIAPYNSKKVEIIFKNKVISRPYLEMTLSIMEKFGAKTYFSENKISVENTGYKGNNFTVEADWSSASYWYEIAALSENCNIEIYDLRKESWQGDAQIAEIFVLFGVKTEFKDNSIVLTKEKDFVPQPIQLNLNKTPDLAQTIVCTSAAMQIETKLTGLETLKIKETDRLLALKNELLKFGIQSDIIDDSAIHLKGNQAFLSPNKAIKTYADHRMAMAFAPLSLKVNNIIIQHPEVVSKSYPNYWKDLKMVGFNTINQYKTVQ